MLNEVDDFEVMDDQQSELTYEDAERELLQAERSNWISQARMCYEASSDYIESSVRSQWQRNLYNFQGRHKEELDRKRKIFRPKVRTALRAHEAALASALFTNNDVVDIVGANPDDSLQEASAKFNKALVQHRLTKTIPWFQTVLGAYQDANVYGRCVSKTYWSFETKEIKEEQPILDESGDYVLDEEGYALAEEVVVGQDIITDEPVIDLIAPENFLYDPNADWRDPIQDSPYLIEIMPMFASDVLERMGKEDQKLNSPSWHKYTLEQVISSSSRDDNESIRQTRQGRRQDPTDINTSNEHQTVYVHFNIIRKDGEDMAFYTLGTTLLLSDPVPLVEYFKHGRDVYTLGVSSIEAHKNEPQALAELGENLQREANIIANQRIENVKLVLNKRYFIKRQGNVDLGALMRNVPGGGVMVDDPQNDVNIVNTPDVTGSSYAEQDRLNMDIDDILGSFSQSTIAANRQLNETVGGMNLMANATNTVQEYIMRTFIETWVEPVMRTLVKLEQMYETDQTILSLAGDKAGIKDQIMRMAGNPQVLDQLIQQDLLVTVNVGMGNTNPEQKLKRLMMAIDTVAGMPEAASRVNWDEVVSEVYAYAGYGDGTRFTIQDDGQPKQEAPPPEIQLEQMKQKHDMAMMQAKQQHEMQMAQLKAQSAIQGQQVRAQAEAQADLVESNNRRELELIKLSEEKGIKLEEMRAKLAIESSKDKTKRDIEALKSNLISRELDVKNRMGSGI